MFRRLLLALVLVLGMGTVPAQAADDFPFRDPGLPLAQRIDDLLGRLTPAEKISWLHQYQPAVPRLGIGSFKTGTEALHGVAWSTDVEAGGAVRTAAGTVFPQAVGLASTWDPALIKRVGAAVGTEARGYHAENPRVWGLQLWAPVVNLLRDPRWGRNEEGYSEDPLLTGAISTAYGKGITGDDPDYLRAAPVLKHYLANNNEVNRTTTNSSLPARVLKEYEEPAFRTAISAGAATGVMTSYNVVNGRPATVTDLNSSVRSWSTRDLFNVTDAHAPNNLVDSQRYYPDLAQADAATLKAGVDSFTTDDTNSARTTTAVTDALAAGLITETDVDTAVRHILSIRFRLGEFDPGGGPYGNITKAVVDSPAHRALNRETAGKATVLLKNSGLLPLTPNRKIAVIGPLGDTLYTDWYGGNLPYRVTTLDGIKERATATGTEGVDRVAFKHVASGGYITATGTTDADTVGTAAALTSAAQWDLTDWGEGVVTLRNAGNGRYLGWNFAPFITRDDQPNGWFVQQQFKLEPAGDGNFLIRYVGYEVTQPWFWLPETYVQVDPDGKLSVGAKATAARFTKEVVTDGIATAVAAAKAADVAVVVVGSMPFINGREDHDRNSTKLAEGQEALAKAVRAANPKTVVVLQNSYPATIDWLQDHVPAILWTTHAGAETGHALADVLYGDVNPAGRLTQTWHRAGAPLPPITDYDIIKTGSTYLYYSGSPLYPFGHGLSYTTFGYQGLTVTPQGAGYEISVKVTNTGNRAGDEVVQLYTHQRHSRVKQPIKQLRGFQRVTLAPGASTTVRFKVARSDLALWDVTRNRFVTESATHDVLVGSSSTAIRQRTTVNVPGEQIPRRDLTRLTRASDFDDYFGIELVDETKPTGTAVGGTVTGDWIAFKDADLRGPAAITAGVSSVAGGSIQVRLGSPTGRLIGTVPVPATGDVYSWTTATAPLTRTTGTQDVYLVFTGDLRIRTLTLS
ncbi:beta-glucosidase [Acrocarpospora pleiomorpha]|uniref:Exo-alpha-(1->6)-L-arabinopyranosidase n=1 Tax=Acrocarpospora pleiomorpha TaxID=90975 RepID=A0A5M3XRZ5_9ACTN|nr:glycoside hydrolase family 3 C-terminal domain-containing protein [Acrocarpospora pleiomorpha]GES23822.1 beta-glucosidase [Acrocarpospora pleiomorpha]